MNHSTMSDMDMSGTMTATASAASSTSSAMDMSQSMGGCKISMLWNWYTIDACFLSSSWRIRSNGTFAVTCIGVVLLVVSLEFFRRLGKEYDAMILRKYQQYMAGQAADRKRLCNVKPSSPYVTFRATPLQQLIRAAIHAVTFGIAYIIMLLAMYYNGYVIICIFLGAGLGKFVCDWTSHKVSLNLVDEDTKSSETDETTVCCG